MSASHWSEVTERGSVRALRFAAWVHRHLGRAPMRVLLRCASLYFFAFAPGVRRASRRYLERIWQLPDGRAALGRAPGPRSVIAHIYSFATSVYDRMVVLGGELDAYQIEHDRSGEIFELAREKRGALLLGAHLGSFELLWFLSRKYDLAVNVVAYFENAARINAFLDSLDPGARVRAIGLDPGSVRSAFEIRACIERGEFVVILADRVPPGARARCAQATFLGASAAFPIGPFELAGVLDCPVLLALCVRTGEDRYRTVLRPLRDAARIARVERDARARELLLRYVAALESYCMRFPYEWFNFFDFWGETPERAS
jgi:predicted LPLAT superfamily acyltransferase